MTKRIVNILLLSLLSLIVVKGQETTKDDRSGGFARLKALGDNPYYIDPTDIMVNPAWASKFNNILFGDLGSTIANNFESGGVGQYLAVNFNITRNLTLGAALARKDFISKHSVLSLDPYGIVSETNSAIGTGQIIEMDNNWLLFSSFNLGGHVLGFGFSYASTNREIKPANTGGTVGNASQFGINVGYLGKILPNFKLDLSGILLFPGTSFENPQSSETNFSQTVMILKGRGFFRINSKFTIVPVVSLLKTSGTAELGDATGITTTDLNSIFSVLMGVGVKYQINNFLFAGGPSFELINGTTPSVSGVSPELSQTTRSFPIWNFGAEWHMLEWLIGRIGYRAKSSTIESESVASPTTVNKNIITAYDPNFSGITLGLGFRFSGFALDATVNEDVIRQGFNNLGGGGATFVYISAGYSF